MTPLFLFAPGAGAPSTHPWMEHWRERLSSIGAVEPFDYRYLREGRKRPDRLPDLVAAHREALAAARQRLPSAKPVILAGKSMGGRIGCHLSLEEKVDGLVCFGYPLCGGGDAKKLRDRVLRDLRTPVLFIQGTRDPLCPLDLLAQIRPAMPAPNALHIVEGGDHSLLVGKRALAAAGKSQDEFDREILAAIARFALRLCASQPGKRGTVAPEEEN